MQGSPGRLISRRRFLQGAGAAGVTAAAGWPSTAAAAQRPAAGRRQPSVGIVGGGIGGLTAAHELAERGFHVTVYERRAWGGKARSIDVPDSARDGRRPLPGEHGYRVIFGQYRNLPETLGRIPTGTNSTVLDNLVAGPQVTLSRAGRADLVLPIGASDPRPYTAEQVIELIAGVLLQTGLGPVEAAHFVQRLLVFLSSGDARRQNQWEHESWWDYIDANGRSQDYQDLLAVPWTRLLQALRPEQASARAIGRILELIIYGQLGFGMAGPFIRVTDQPTNEAWIDPWVALLSHHGVDLRLGTSVTSLNMRRGVIDTIEVSGIDGRQTERHDWYVCALPIERASRLWNSSIRSADPSLARAAELETRWMNGIQYFLREPTPIANGPIGYLNSPWALSSVSKAQFWPRSNFSADFGDGQARDCLSVDIGDWDEPGVLYSKPARDCTPEEIASETWAQLKLHLNDWQATTLSDDLLVSWHLDPGLLRSGSRIIDSEDPLVVPTPGSWHKRPPAGTAIPNLVLAADYVRTDFEAQTMEAANEAGRSAANEILLRAGSASQPCRLVDTYRPPEWQPLQALDDDRFARGLPNLFDRSVIPPIDLDPVKAVSQLVAQSLLATHTSRGRPMAT